MLKLEASKASSTRKYFDPTNFTLQFSGSLEAEELNYSLILSRGFTINSEGQITHTDDAFIDVDFYRQNVKGLSNLQTTVQTAIIKSKIIAEKFLDEVLAWQN